MWLLVRISCLMYFVTTCLTQTVEEEKEDVNISLGSPELSIPCTGLKSADSVDILYWYKGESLEKALGTVLMRYDSSSGDLNSTANEKYRLTPTFDLVVSEIEATDTGRYWCRVVELNTGEQQAGSVTVTVVSSTSNAQPVVSPCSKSGNDVCNVVESRRLVVDCSVTNVSPRPTLTWLFIGCSGGNSQSQQWFLSNQQLSYDEDMRGYNVSQGVYLGRLELEKDDTCSFECETTGLVVNNGSSTIVNGSASVTLVITGKDKTNGGGGPDDTNSGGGVTPTKAPSLALTAVIIVLAFISLLCLIGIVYLLLRVWSTRGTTKADDEIEMTKCKDNHDEKTCLLSEETDTAKTQDITGEITRWRYKGKLSKKRKGSRDPLEGVIGVLPLAGGGLVVATQSGLQCFSSNFAAVAVKEDAILSRDSIISMASHPNTDSLVVALETGGLALVSVSTGDTKSLFSKEVGRNSQIDSPEIAVDDLGTIFAGKRTDRTVIMMETHTDFVSKFSVGVNISTIAAYGSRNVFVSNGEDTIQKYHVKRSKSDYNMKSRNKISINPTMGSFAIKQITVHAGLLYAVIGYDTGCRIQQYDVENCDLLQTFCTNLCNLQGLCFFGEFKVALYETRSVKIYEKSESDRLDEYVLV